MAQPFDALDFFQTHQLQERNALRSLENSRQNLQTVRGKLEESELQLMLKKKLAGDLRKRLTNLYSASTISGQLDLLSSQFSLMSTVERKTGEKIAQVEEQHCKDDDTACSAPDFEENEADIQKVMVAKSSISCLNKELSATAEELASRINSKVELESSIVPLNEHFEALKLEANALMQASKETSSHIKVLERETIALEEEKETLFQARLHARKSEMENQAHVENQAMQIELQTKKARLTELEARHTQKNQRLDERKKEQSGLQNVIASLEAEMTDLENRSQIDCQVLSKRLEELRLRLNQLRESPISEEECWNRHKTEQEARFMKECASTIEPKREVVTGLKRTLREKEESFTRMVKDYAAQYDALS